MAAPTIEISKKCATLSNLIKKEKHKKKARNVLCLENDDWPRPSPEVEEEILKKLSEQLSSLPNIFKPGDDTKVQIRSQIVIGVSTVFRALEKQDLACILVSGQATPAISVNHVISLAKDLSCPLLCLNHLSTTIAKATESKVTPLAFGFKKMEDSKFADVISLVALNTTCENVSMPVAVKSDKHEVEPASGDKYLWPISFDAEVEADILDEFVRVLSKAPKESTGKSENKMNKKKRKDRKKKQCLKKNFKGNFSHQFEIGKHDVIASLEMGKLQLVFVSKEVKNMLATESTTKQRSLLYIAQKKKCPVFCISEMLEAAKPHFGGGVAFFGLKKFSDAHGPCFSDFEKLVKKIKTYASDNLMTTQISEDKKDSVEMESCAVEKIIENSSDDEDDDYSHLYITKKDSKELSEKLEIERQKNDDVKKTHSFSTDFISISSDSTNKAIVMAKSSVEQKPQKDSSEKEKLDKQLEMKKEYSSTTIPFAIDRGGKKTNKEGELEIANKNETKDLQAPALFSIDGSGKTGKISDETPLFTVDKNPTVFGDKDQASTDKSVEVLGDLEPIPKLKFVPLDPSLSMGKNKALKRKLKSDPTYISLSYNETNIHTMVANVEKKKRKKKK